MPPGGSYSQIEMLDVSGKPYAYRLCAAALQGILNRNAPTVFLDYGIYDDPDARRTNEVFLDDELWYGKYRTLLGNQDQRNLEYYRQAHGFQTRGIDGLDELIRRHQESLNGCVLWDAAMPDTANLALMLASQEDLLIVEAGMETWARRLGLAVRHDLRGKWKDRVDLYAWAFTHLFHESKLGVVACVEPAWQRPEFVDYLVQQKIFTYSLSSRSGGWGDTLLLLLAFGPPRLREWIFSLTLDGPLRLLGLALMGWRSSEVRLATRIQQAVQANPYPTIFGWHTKRDDELAFMLHLSANGLRLAPAHLAGNYSFHSQVKPLGMPPRVPVAEPELDLQGTYLTFTLSDGDQLMMMNGGELGNWYNPQRGCIPFNWETQPLLVELAPALFEKYARTASSNDCLIAGPSGAGYVIPPLLPHLSVYLEESRRVCLKAGIGVVTFYIADPPSSIIRTLAQHSQGLTGFLAGYAVQERILKAQIGEAMFVTNQWPTVAHLWDQAEDLLEAVRRLIAAPGPRPRFIGVHLFAYRTTLTDVIRFVSDLDDSHVHVVRADTFLRLALRNQQKPPSGKQNNG
jgi:hypothetical protein